MSDRTIQLVHPMDDHFGLVLYQSMPEVFASRWYIISVFSLFTFSQCCAWAIYGPISQVAEEVYHWNDNTIAMLANWSLTSTFYLNA
jgi:hypothetical protein